MTAVIWTVIAAVFQIILLTLQKMAANTAASNAAKAAKSKGISDAVSSGDISRLNSAINSVRSK